MKSNTSNEVSPKQAPHFLILLLLYFCSMSASTLELGYGFRSLGHTFEVGHKFSDSFNARLSLSKFDFTAKCDAGTSEIPTLQNLILDKSSSMELEQFSLLIDYHPWQGDFRFTGGYTDNKILFSVDNRGDGDFVINGVTFSDQVVDSTSYQLQLTNGASPYFGIGWSTGFDKESGFSISGDLGIYYAVDTAVKFDAECSEKASRLQCVMLKINTKKEQYYLEKESATRILPMFGMGLSYKF